MVCSDRGLLRGGVLLPFVMTAYQRLSSLRICSGKLATAVLNHLSTAGSRSSSSRPAAAHTSSNRKVLVPICCRSMMSVARRGAPGVSWRPRAMVSPRRATLVAVRLHPCLLAWSMRNSSRKAAIRGSAGGGNPELRPLVRSAVGHGREGRGRAGSGLCPVFPAGAAWLPCAGMAEVGQKQLLAELVGRQQLRIAFPASGGDELAPAEPAPLIVVDGNHHAAGPAGSFGVLSSPEPAGFAEPLVDPADAPGMAVPARGHRLRCAAMAAVAKPCGVVALDASAPPARRRDERASGHAAVAELRPARMAPRDRPQATDGA
jgi:hypothetical protein